ncbi:MAG: PqqD family protein [Acidobacteriota bacterium]
MKSQKPLCRKDNIVVQELEGEVLVYDLSDNRAVCLNETSALIWQACDGSKTPAEISEFISKKLNTTANEDLVWLALDQLKKENLIENSDALPNHFAGMSRREAIKKVGLSSLIALPVIMAVTSPAAAAAGSFCGANLNAACQCNLGGGVPAPPSGPGQFCTDVSAAMLCNATGAAPCQCFVPTATPQDMGTLQYPGTCIENV